jgi:formate-dependent nitrite reductase membrane component NrfD
MNSLAPLAHTAAPAPFNGLFYATAATIIPVLFLAVAVQGGTYQVLLNALLESDRRQPQATTRLRRWLAAARTNTLLTFTLAILGAVVSETWAVIVLYIQKPVWWSGPIVLTGTIFLIAAIAIPPITALGRMARTNVEPDETDTPSPAPGISE